MRHTNLALQYQDVIPLVDQIVQLQQLSNELCRGAVTPRLLALAQPVHRPAFHLCCASSPTRCPLRYFPAPDFSPRPPLLLRYINVLHLLFTAPYRRPQQILSSPCFHSISLFAVSKRFKMRRPWRATMFCFVPFCLTLFTAVLGVPYMSEHYSRLPSTVRAATYEDISTTFQLFFNVSADCPSSITFGEYTNDQRQFPIIAMSDIEEGGSECTGDDPLFIITGKTITQEGLMEKLNLQEFQDAITANSNANALAESKYVNDLLWGWHASTRTCGGNSYPPETIYTIINEDEDFSLTFSEASVKNRITIPPTKRALLIIAPKSQICLLVDSDTSPDKDVTLVTIGDGGEQAFILTENGREPVTSSNDSDDDGSNTEADGDSESDPSPTPSEEPSASPSPSTADESEESPSPSASASPLPSIVDVPEPIPPSPSESESPVPSATSIPSAIPSSSPFISVLPLPSATPLPSGAGNGSALGDENVDSTSEEEDDGSACFPASAQVHSSRGTVTMHDLEIGDRVQTANGYSDVILFTHRSRSTIHAFVKLRTQSGRDLTVTGGHYLYKQNGDLAAAATVCVGDVLRMANASEDGTIKEVETVRGIGLYNPQTESGSIVVNGFITSTYTTAVEPKLAHMALLMPVRFMYGVWRWPVEQLSYILSEGTAAAQWMPRGNGLVMGL